MCMQLVVKNTFICAVDISEDAEQPEKQRRRARTSDARPCASVATDSEDDSILSERSLPVVQLPSPCGTPPTLLRRAPRMAAASSSSTEQRDAAGAKGKGKEDRGLPLVQPPRFHALPPAAVDDSVEPSGFCAARVRSFDYDQDNSFVRAGSLSPGAAAGQRQAFSLQASQAVRAIVHHDNTSNDNSNSEPEHLDSAGTLVGSHFDEDSVLSLLGRLEDATVNFEGSSVELQRLRVDAARTVASELKMMCNGAGFLGNLACSPSGLRLIDALLMTLPQQELSFMTEELVGYGRRLSTSALGSQALCRMVEQMPGDPALERLMDEVLEEQNPEGLCLHKFGHALATVIVVKGSDCHRRQLSSALASHVQRFARHRFASQVIESALAHGRPEERDVLIKELLRYPAGLAKLACHCFGTHVVRRLLALPSARAEAMASLKGCAGRLRKDRYGAKLMQELGFEA